MKDVMYLPRFCAACFVALSLSLMMWGCAARNAAPPEAFFIPEQDTALDQFQYAQYLHSTTMPSTDRAKRQEQMMRIVQAYEMVYTRFPDDRLATPRARVVVGMLYARMPEPHFKAEALTKLADVERSYPDIDLVLAPALFNQGLLYDQMGRYEQAQAKYREVFERWGNSQEPELKSFATRARERFNRVRARS